MRSKLLSLAILMLWSAVASSQPVAAHVLIRDESNSVGAVLHVTPDDDPIAGQTSFLYFNLQNRSLNGSDVSITVTDASDQSTLLKTAMTQLGVEAEYTFPSRGTYDISLKIEGATDYNFLYTQRVARGIGTDTSSAPDYPLARALLILSSVAIVFVALIVFDRRKSIFTQSTF